RRAVGLRVRAMIGGADECIVRRSMAPQRRPIHRTDVEARAGELREAIISAIAGALFEKHPHDPGSDDQQCKDDQESCHQKPTAMPCRSYASARSILTVATSPIRSGRWLAT